MTATLVIVGVQRCGTTHLAQLLDDHPAIEMMKPLRPEPKSFLRGSSPADAEEFRSLAGGAGEDTLVIGEKSTSYLDHDASLERIASALPYATILVMLRDPVDRAISHYRFSSEHGVEVLPMEQALMDASLEKRPFDAGRMSVSPFAYFRRGRYAEDIRRLHRIFGPSRVHPVIFEELVDEVAVIAGVYERVGVAANHRPAGFEVAHNASRAPIRQVSPEVEQHLAAYYADPNRDLESLLRRSLPWRRA